MKIVLNLQFLTCKKYSEYRSTVKNCNFSKLQFFQCSSTVITLHIFAVRLIQKSPESPHFMYALKSSAASESVSATTARKMRYSRETETWAKDTVNSRRHDMFSRLFRDYQSDLKKRKLLLLDDDDGKFSSSLYFAEDQWSDWVLTSWHTRATNIVIM